MQITPVIFDCPRNARDPPDRVLKMTANRYCTHESASNDEGFTLLFAHCIGSHKEQWEPVIEQAFRMQQGKARNQRVREAWSFDWQSHGDAGILNRELLQVSGTRADGVSAYEWAEAIAAFVRSPRMQGRRIVAIGHSAGAGAMVVSLKSTPLSHLPFLGLVLIEPTIAKPELYYRVMADNTPTIEAATLLRRSRWASRGEAKEWLRKRAPYRKWDERVLALFIEYGLDDTSIGDVKLKCDRRLEALAFPDVHPHFDAFAELGRISGRVPVHVIWASRSELVPKALQDALADTKDGRRLASVTHVEGGHLLPQESPVRIAHAIANALDSIAVDFANANIIPAERSRL
ncbi:CN hydrolase domain-containing protein [Favolaschia claudopus]|uniref:CN hydrolase domain-containing protein n=1 Tax=Favolaschia claudopus TaxID=2862362 RepID=A0AAW0DPE7_9AGAR